MVNECPTTLQELPLQYNDETCLMGVGIDISEKVNAEKSLQKSHKQLTTAQEIAKLGYWEWNWDTNETYWSDEMYKICGSNKSDGPIPEETFKMMIHPDDRQKVSADRQAMAKDGMGRETEFRFITSNGDVCYIQAVSSISFDKNGKLIRVEGTLQDITESKKRDLKLQQSYERFDLIAKATNDALFEWCPSSNKAWWSDSHYLLFGFDRANGLPSFDEWLEKIHPEDQGKILEKLEQIQNRKATGWTDEIRYEIASNKYGTLPDQMFRLYGCTRRATQNSGLIPGSHREQKSRRSYSEI